MKKIPDKKNIEHVILDLDQTIISAEVLEDFDRSEKTFEKAIKFDFENIDGYYIVFLRPGLQEFLKFLFKNFKVSVWTAASQAYAHFIIDKILLEDQDRKLENVFFDYHCKLSKKWKKKTKDLSNLWEKFGYTQYNYDNTIIIDDLNEVYNTQPNNCISIKAFEFTDKDSVNDTELLKLKDILKNMKKP
jgi:TFIIF-interacting CTD phosphatase-like protein